MFQIFKIPEKPSPRGRKRDQKDMSKNGMSEFLEACTGVLRNAAKRNANNNNNENEDEGMDAARHFASKLKKMNSDQQIYAELLIQHILTLGQLNKLTDSTDIEDSAVQLITMGDSTVILQNGDTSTPKENHNEDVVFET